MAVTAQVTDDSFEVTLSGLDAVWALARRLTIALADIVDVRVVPRRDAVGQLRWRVGGAHWPGRITAGHFTLRSRDGRAFASVYRAPEVLQVTTRVERPRLVLLQHPSVHELARDLDRR